MNFTPGVSDNNTNAISYLEHVLYLNCDSKSAWSNNVPFIGSLRFSYILALFHSLSANFHVYTSTCTKNDAYGIVS